MLLFAGGPIIAIVAGFLLATHTTFLKDQAAVSHSVQAQELQREDQVVTTEGAQPAPQTKKRDDDQLHGLPPFVPIM